MAAIIVASFLFGCGSGGSDGDGRESAPSNSTIYKLGEFLTTGSRATCNITGSDTAGGVYSGTGESIVDGPTVVDGRNVIQKRNIRSLAKMGEWAYTSTQTFYYNPDKTLYKYEDSNGTMARSTNYFVPPDTVKVGYSGNGWAWKFSDGATMNSTWHVSDPGDGNATLTIK